MRRRASGSGADEDDGLNAGAVEEVDTDSKDALTSPSIPPKNNSDDPIDQAVAGDSKMEDFYRKQQQRARLRSPWSCSIVTMVCTALSLLLLATIAQSFLGRQLDPKGCNMSYMLSAFAKYTDFDTEHTRFATKYSLYLYREAGIDQDTRVRLQCDKEGMQKRLADRRHRSRVSRCSSSRAMQAATNRCAL